jgi:hypothetical protein
MTPTPGRKPCAGSPGPPPPPSTPTPSRPSSTSWPTLYALASFTEPELAAQTFELALSEVRTQNAPFVLQSLVANRVNGPAAWQHLTEEWDSLVAKFPSNILPRMLDGVRGLCAPPELADQVTAFIGAHPLPAGGRTVEQILERLAVNVAFGQREGGQLAADLGKALELP